MIFASASFLFIFLPIFIFVYYLIPTVFCFLKKKNADLIVLRNYTMIVMSLLFYSWGETKNVILLFILGVINYYGGNRIYQTKSIFCL